MPEVDKYVMMAKQVDASDLHLSIGNPPVLRLHGVLRRIKHPPLTPEDTERIIMEVLDDEQKAELEETWEMDFAYEMGDIARCRSNVCKHLNGYDLTMRLVPKKIKTLDELGLPPVVKRLLQYRQGLILVTGKAGCGKTTTLAGMVDYLNSDRRDHIITLEDPIEILHDSRKCHIIQREVGPHTESFARALRACLREDPDIILVGEMRDLETVSMAITAAETGHLVMGTLHTTTAARTIGRVLDVYPPSQQGQIRTMLAGSLRGIISQQLLPRADGNGRVIALEVLVVTPAVSNMIAQDRTVHIPSVMQTGIKLGMRLMDDSLMELYHRGIVSADTALEFAVDRTKFRAIDEHRRGMIAVEDLMAMSDDDAKRKECLIKGAAERLRRGKRRFKIVPREEVPHRFFQRRGKLQVEEIYAELLRLFPDSEEAAEAAAAGQTPAGSPAGRK